VQRIPKSQEKSVRKTHKIREQCSEWQRKQAAKRIPVKNASGRGTHSSKQSTARLVISAECYTFNPLNLHMLCS